MNYYKIRHIGIILIVCLLCMMSISLAQSTRIDPTLPTRPISDTLWQSPLKYMIAYERLKLAYLHRNMTNHSHEGHAHGDDHDLYSSSPHPPITPDLFLEHLTAIPKTDITFTSVRSNIPQRFVETYLGKHSGDKDGLSDLAAEEAMYKAFHTQWPAAPFVRVEVEAATEDAFTEWQKALKSYSSHIDDALAKDGQNIGIADRVLLTSRYVSQYTNNNPRGIIIIEPDELTVHGDHYHLRSEMQESAGYMLLFILATVLICHVGIKYWEQNHKSSYDIFTVIALWLVPLFIAARSHFTRFLIIWCIYSVLTLLALSPLIIRIKHYFDIPQRYLYSLLYRYFLLCHKVILVLASTSLFVFILDLLGVFKYIGLEPAQVGASFRGHEATPDDFVYILSLAFHGVFYAIYIGVLNRDVATVIVPALTLLSLRSTPFGTTHAVTQKDQDTIQLFNKQQQERQQQQQQQQDHLDQDNIETSHLANNLGTILDHDTSLPSSSSSTITTVLPDSHYNNGDISDAEDMYDTESSHLTGSRRAGGLLSSHHNNNKHKQQQQQPDQLHRPLIKVSDDVKHHTCGICHDVIDSTGSSSTNTTSSSSSDMNNDDLGITNHQSIEAQRRAERMLTVEAIRSRINNNKEHASNAGSRYLYTITLYLIDFLNDITGGTGAINSQYVTVTQKGSSSIYKLSLTTQGENASTITPPNATTTAVIDLQNQVTAHNKSSAIAARSHTAAATATTASSTTHDPESTSTGDGNDINLSSSHIFGSLRSSLAADDSDNDDDSRDMMRQTSANMIFELPCGCLVHDMCLRGHMMLGKRDTCPQCREVFVSTVYNQEVIRPRVGGGHRTHGVLDFYDDDEHGPFNERDLDGAISTTTTADGTTYVTRRVDIIQTPWDGIYDNYRQVLEVVRYLLAINPLIFLIINYALNVIW